MSSMDLFSLEALDAASGDALLVHYGRDRRRLLVVDSGFAHTYDSVVRPRLAALAQQRQQDAGATDPFGGSAPLPVELLVVSHLDTDHIAGVERLLAQRKREQDQGTDALLDVRRLWHNAFDDCVRAATGHSIEDITPVEELDEVRAASVGHAQRVRDLAQGLGLDGNQPFGGLVTGVLEVDDLGEGVTATVIAPTQTRLEKLRQEWVAKTGGDESAASAAAYVDESAPNLSSIVVHLRSATGRTMLLTGDARGDHVLEGLAEAKLLDANSHCNIDLLKIPHHGSDRNLEESFFERVTADHYVISGNGRHDNPSKDTLAWIESTQGSRPYTLWLTYDHNTEWIRTRVNQPDRKFRIEVRAATAPSVVVNLGQSPA